MKRKVFELPKIIKNLEIVTRGLVNTQFVGTYTSVFKGTGMEFDGYREYTPMDDSKHIDWKASARVNKLIVKEFVEERNLQVLFLFDVSNSMIFGSTEKLKNEYAAEVIATLAYTIIKSGDSAGFIMFSDKINAQAYPAFGNRQFYNITRHLADYDLYGGSYDLGFALKFLFTYLKRRTLVILVSDFLGLRKGWDTIMRMASQKFDMIGVMIRDPRDMDLPDDVTQIVLSDPYAEEDVLLDPKLIKEKYSHLAREQVRAVKQTFLDAGSDFLELYTDKDYVNEITKFFKGRAERLS